MRVEKAISSSNLSKLWPASAGISQVLEFPLSRAASHVQYHQRRRQRRKPAPRMGHGKNPPSHVYVSISGNTVQHIRAA